MGETRHDAWPKSFTLSIVRVQCSWHPTLYLTRSRCQRNCLPQETIKIPSEVFEAQAALLVRALPYVAAETCFALKGGTAIYVPRLSVNTPRYFAGKVCAHHAANGLIVPQCVVCQYNA